MFRVHERRYALNATHCRAVVWSLFSGSASGTSHDPVNITRSRVDEPDDQSVFTLVNMANIVVLLIAATTPCSNEIPTGTSSRGVLGRLRLGKRGI